MTAVWLLGGYYNQMDGLMSVEKRYLLDGLAGLEVQE
jgi:hypothetical protein